MNSVVTKAVNFSCGIFRSVFWGAFVDRIDDGYPKLSETPFADDKKVVKEDYACVENDWRAAIEKVDRARAKDSDSGSKQRYRAADCPSA